jgi:breast cancer 2 susceptibility protein
MISGNSSQLAPWHAKLGFQRDLFIATLNSLTPDGGVIAAMDVVVMKVGALLPFKHSCQR